MFRQQPQNTMRSAERLKAYTDAVVAIAQTLLILPLLESVSDAKAHHLTTAQWFTENSDAMVWLVMSFVLIGTFWIIHQRVFEHVEHPSQGLQATNFIWMLTIVVFPVIAAVLGLTPPDNLQKTLYIGCMLVCSLAMNSMVLQVNHDPQIRGDLPPLGASNVAASFSQTLLYLLALIVALNISGGTGYFALMLMAAMPLTVRLLTPLVKRLGWGI